jgi:predicted metal-dependent HD superfamily phosphohydrolase
MEVVNMPLTKYRQLEELAYAVARTCKEGEYHNFFHARDVANTIGFMCELEGVDAHASHIGQAAGLIHDYIRECNCSDNEERSYAAMRPVLYELGFPEEDVKAIGQLVLSSKVGVEPKTLLERIMYDADRANMGRFDFPVMYEALMAEEGVSMKSWAAQTLDILKQIRYRTGTGRKLFGPGLRENTAFLEALVQPNQKADTSLTEEIMALARYGRDHPFFAIAKSAAEQEDRLPPGLPNP